MLPPSVGGSCVVEKLENSVLDGQSVVLLHTGFDSQLKHIVGSMFNHLPHCLATVLHLFNYRLHN